MHLPNTRYSTQFAVRLARCVRSHCSSSSTVAFICCPTGFVAFQHTNPLEGARLLEYDQRFAVLAPKQFVPYDLDEPNKFPEDLRGTVDIAIVDPPFLNEVRKIPSHDTHITQGTPTDHQQKNCTNPAANSASHTRETVAYHVQFD